MAELLNKIPTNLTEYPNSFKRQGAFPLEAYSVFYTKTDAETYAATNPVAYVGQTLAVVTTNKTDTSIVDNVAFYIIADSNGTLQEVGKDMEVSDYSITSDTSIEGQVTYQLTKGDEPVGEAIIVPIVDVYDDTALNNRLAKVEEFFKTTEGESLSEALDTLVEIQKYIADDSEVASTVLENKAAIETLNGTGEGSVAKAVSDAITALNLDQYTTDTEFSDAVAGLVSQIEDKATKGTTLADYGIKDAYTSTQTDEAIRAKISEMTGGESAADVLGLLNDYKAANDRAVWGDDFVNQFTSEGKYTPDYSGATNIIARIVSTDIPAAIQEAKDYTDEKIAAIPAPTIATTEVAGIVKASDEIAVNSEDGTMRISKVSTDVLVMGEKTLVLCGGDSAGHTATTIE